MRLTKNVLLTFPHGRNDYETGEKIMRKKYLLTAILTTTFGLAVLMGCGSRGDKKVYFGNLANFAQLESPFKVEMKAENLIVEPAIMGVKEGSGHFHIIVDGPLSPPGSPIAKNETHIHYGQGESETILDLPVGPHTLVLQFAKGDHIPYDPALVQLINITVTKRNTVDTTALQSVNPADTSDAFPDDSLKAPSPDTTHPVSKPDTSMKAAPKTK
jgi:hypothetical protein